MSCIFATNMTTAITARRGTAAKERINYIGVGVLQKDYTKSRQTRYYRDGGQPRQKEKSNN